MGGNRTMAELHLIQIEYLKSQGYSHKKACERVWGTEEERRQTSTEINVILFSVWGLIGLIVTVVLIVQNIQ